MSKDKEDDEEYILFNKLHKSISLTDKLLDYDINKYIKLPIICSPGALSPGKSPIEESIKQLDFFT